jgi:hypothetical protein
MSASRRPILLVVTALVAAGLVVSTMRSGQEPSASTGAVDPRPVAPGLRPSGALAIEAPRDAEAALNAAPSLVPPLVAPPRVDGGGVQTAPIDSETGQPLEPARILEGSSARMPIPRRVLDRGSP